MLQARKTTLALLVVSFMAMLTATRAYSLSFDSDSIRTWGKFANFCIDAYKWGDRFFNSYDTAYVDGTGYKFNFKNHTETWADQYDFNLPDDIMLRMRSDACTSTGFHLSYLAVSVGYDLNVSKWFGSREPARKRFSFAFNCALFSADAYWTTNRVSTRIREFGDSNHPRHMDIRFRGIDTSILGLSFKYFLNHKRYSWGAAFNNSKVQKRSQGSFFFGYNYWRQDFKFDFGLLPDDIKSRLPASWADNGYKYRASSRNYGILAGYGFNWVFAPHWLLGVAEAPVFGLKYGYVNNSEKSRYSFSLYNRARLSLTWTNRRWFAGMIMKVENGLVYDKNHSLINTMFNVEATVGVRFNLW